jgi:hypothetical protein
LIAESRRFWKRPSLNSGASNQVRLFLFAIAGWRKVGSIGENRFCHANSFPS